MSSHLIFILLGLANGAVYASLAMGLVVTYRSSGVLNFATGAMALFGACEYSFFRRGRLLLPILGVPRSVSLGTGPTGFVPAAAATLLLCAVLGLVLYLLVFRPLRAAPAVAKAVASVGVMVVLTNIVVVRLGTAPVAVAHIFPQGLWRIGDVLVAKERVWFAVTVVGIALLLGVAFRATRFGLATRAAAETEKGAFVAGLSPDRIAAVNWMISGAVAGVAGIFIASMAPLPPVSYTLLVVPALAAALIGGFERVNVAVLAGLGIGMLQSEIQYLVTQHPWSDDQAWFRLPSSGVPDLVPLILILLVLVVRARPLPGRGAVVQRTLGRAPRPHDVRLPAVLATTVAVVAMVVMQHSWRAALITSLIFAIISLSYVVVTGLAGQVSLAQLTIAGVAGFFLSPLTTDWGVPFPIAPVVAALGAALIGVVVGLPAVRIRGLPVAVVTLALAVVVEGIWFRNSDFVGANGKAVSGPSLFGVDLGVGSGTGQYPRLAFGLTVLVILVIIALGVVALRVSRFGSAMLAVRANERSAAAAGIDVVRTKVIAFAIAAFIAGLGGCMLAYKQTTVTFEPFTVLLGVTVLATAYLAGITSVSGAILAGTLAVGGIWFKLFDIGFGDGAWYPVLTAVLLVVTIVRNPEGIVGPIHAKIDARRNRSSIATSIEMTSRALDRTTVTPPRQDRGIALELRDVTVRYGGVTAVDRVSFDIETASIVGLIGPNGAGKTTLIDAISGFARSTGSIVLSGQELTRIDPFRRTRLGLGRTFQAIELYDDLSVRENVVVGQFGSLGHIAADDRALDAVFELLGLTPVQHRPAGELSQGERQLVSMARALAGQPRLLMLDEPAGGLDATESRWLGDRLRDIRDSGVTILLIDHDMHLVLNLCDTVQVLDFGRLLASGVPGEIRNDRGVAAAYLGETHASVTVGDRGV